MTCREFADFMMDYVAGELGAEEKAVFERHLSRCDNCDEYLRQYRATIDAGRRAFERLDDDVPTEVPERLIQAILAARKPR